MCVSCVGFSAKSLLRQELVLENKNKWVHVCVGCVVRSTRQENNEKDGHGLVFDKRNGHVAINKQENGLEMGKLLETY